MYNLERIAEILPELLNYPEDNVKNYLELAQSWINHGITDPIEVWDWVCNGYADPERVADLKTKGQTTLTIVGYTQSIIEQKYKEEVEVKISETMGNINLEYLEVVIRCKGVGTAVMLDVCKIADRLEKSISLNPTSEMGSNYKRLVAFYKRFGFEWVDSETMQRPKRGKGME